MKKENYEEAKRLVARLEDDLDEIEESQELIIKTLLEGEKREKIECDFCVMGENGCYTVSSIRLSNYGEGIMTPLCELIYPAHETEAFFLDLSFSERQQIIDELMTQYNTTKKKKK